MTDNKTVQHCYAINKGKITVQFRSGQVMSCHIMSYQVRPGHLYSERITVSSVPSRFHATNAVWQRNLYQGKATEGKGRQDKTR